MDRPRRIRRYFKPLACTAIFLLAFGVRVLSWHDTRLEVGKVQTVVAADYKHVAQLLRDGGIRSFFSSASPLTDLNTMGHPPGYSILLALTYRLFGESDTAVQFVQIIADALAAIVVLLIIAELFPFSAAVIAGLLAALSPQLAWNSVLLLPDSIFVLPILIAILLLARAFKKPRLLNFIIIGALIGVSCWLRANAMLLALFVAAAVPLLMWAKKDANKMIATRPQDAGAPIDASLNASVWRFTLAVIAGTLLIVLPLTIRNTIVFHRFIPLSLGAGQTLLEGIADYDPQGRFGVPPTDMGIMKQESEMYQRPDYYGTLFNPDGVERERERLSRGFAIIRSHPVWFAGVMAKRASMMMRLERSRRISTQPAISHTMTAEIAPITIEPSQLSSPLELKPNEDYIIEIPVTIDRGRLRLSIIDNQGRQLSTAVVDAIESNVGSKSTLSRVQLPFVATSSPVRIVLSNEPSDVPVPIATVGAPKIFELGPARFLWTRYPRFVIHAIQKIFITAVMLPLAIIGLLMVIFQKKSAAMVILSVVPIYFFTVQSIVHTEYRCVLAVVYFLFAFAAVAVGYLVSFLIKKIIPSPKSERLKSLRAAPSQPTR